jgi:hypothetical protein
MTWRVLALSGLAATAVCGAAFAQTAPVQTAPARRPGWWEMQMTLAGPTPAPSHQTVHICTDPAVEKVQSPFGIRKGDKCPPPQVTRTPAGWSLAASCAMGGMTVNTTGSVTGDFNSRYHVDLVTRMTPPPQPQLGEVRTSIDARWLGPCPAGKKAGDVDLAMSMNVAPDGQGR